MDAKFVRDTAVSEVEPGVYEGRVNRDWWIVFGPNGGFLAALFVRALTAAVGDQARTPRTLTIHYTAAPTEGPVRIATRTERSGRSLSTMTARMDQGDRRIALAIGAFSTAREGGVDFDDTSPPAVPPPEDVPTIPPDPRLPPFTAQWEVKPAIGPRSLTGADQALTGGWIRLRESSEVDAALIAQLTDAWIPAVFTRLEAPNPIPTVELTMHFRSELPLPADWVLSRFESRLSRHGFVEEDGELWTPDGQLIAQSRQLALLQAPSH